MRVAAVSFRSRLYGLRRLQTGRTASPVLQLQSSSACPAEPEVEFGSNTHTVSRLAYRRLLRLLLVSARGVPVGNAVAMVEQAVAVLTAEVPVLHRSSSGRNHLLQPTALGSSGSSLCGVGALNPSELVGPRTGGIIRNALVR